MSEDQRGERYSLQVMSGFDACEQDTVGAANKDLTSGTLTAVSGTPARNTFYCRSMYNTGTSSITVTFNLLNDSTSYVAEIPSGQWHHTYANIKQVLAAGTDAGTLRFGYVKRGKVDGTGNL